MTVQLSRAAIWDRLAAFEEASMEVEIIIINDGDLHGIEEPWMELLLNYERVAGAVPFDNLPPDVEEAHTRCMELAKGERAQPSTIKEIARTIEAMDSVWQFVRQRMNGRA